MSFFLKKEHFNDKMFCAINVENQKQRKKKVKIHEKNININMKKKIKREKITLNSEKGGDGLHIKKNKKERIEKKKERA